MYQPIGCLKKYLKNRVYHDEVENLLKGIQNPVSKLNKLKFVTGVVTDKWINYIIEIEPYNIGDVNHLLFGKNKRNGGTLFIKKNFSMICGKDHPNNTNQVPHYAHFKQFLINSNFPIEKMKLEFSRINLCNCKEMMVVEMDQNLGRLLIGEYLNLRKKVIGEGDFIDIKEMLILILILILIQWI